MDIRKDNTDDPQFIEFANNVLSNLVNHYYPNEIYIVRIDNWFDHKWLKFSGVGVVEFPERGVGLPRDGHAFIENAKKEFHQEKVTFPPFSPKRILSQQYFKNERAKLKNNIHSSYRRSSHLNIQNRVESFSKSGVFIWVSSNSIKNSKGSLMVYIAQEDSILPWYASFSKGDFWKVNRVKGISNKEIEYLIKFHTTRHSTGPANSAGQ
ncbi:hypothetical protein [Desulfogranum japonicum]|uniref:hypothetical protein n=1 Tax=Desulfogranum japonicum TaxID=231447 RepID=UPI00041960F6|nr:hypothetical protein [Desulfogranum japonicum]